MCYFQINDQYIFIAIEYIAYRHKISVSISYLMATGIL